MVSDVSGVLEKAMKRCFLFPMLSVLLFSACTRTRKVMVIDSTTRQPVQGAIVMAAAPSYNTAGMATDAFGIARIPVSPTHHHISVSKPGYQSTEVGMPEQWPLQVGIRMEEK
jgi:hypothetical protein